MFLVGLEIKFYEKTTTLPLIPYVTVPKWHAPVASYQVYIEIKLLILNLIFQNNFSL